MMSNTGQQNAFVVCMSLFSDESDLSFKRKRSKRHISLQHNEGQIFTDERVDNTYVNT